MPQAVYRSDGSLDPPNTEYWTVGNIFLLQTTKLLGYSNPVNSQVNLYNPLRCSRGDRVFRQDDPGIIYQAKSYVGPLPSRLYDPHETYIKGDRVYLESNSSLHLCTNEATSNYHAPPNIHFWVIGHDSHRITNYGRLFPIKILTTLE